MSKKLLALVLVAAIFINAVHSSAAAAVITDFSICGDLDKGYSIEQHPDNFVVKEISSDTLGTIHELTWQNPEGLAKNMQVEIYAVIEFEIFAPKDFGSVMYTTWSQIENSKSRDWITVDTPYAKVYEGLASDNSCNVDFFKLKKTIEDYAISGGSSSSDVAGDTHNSFAFTNLSYALCDWVLSKLGGDKLTDTVCMYDYAVNNMSTSDFRFSKMKYYIRYKKVTDMPDAYNPDTGFYEYYYITETEGIYSTQRWQNIGYLTKPGKIENIATDVRIPDGRIKTTITSSQPMCLIMMGDSIEVETSYNNRYFSSVQEPGYVYFPSKVYCGDLTEYGGMWNKPQMSLQVQLTIYDYSVDKDGVVTENKKGRRITGAERDAVLSPLQYFAAMGSQITGETNIPIFTPIFKQEAAAYLESGKLNMDDLGESLYNPNVMYNNGPLLQNTIGFKGDSLDSSTASSGVIDGNNDTDNGWLKKIYMRLGLMLEIMKGGSGGDTSALAEKLDAIYKRLGWTNTWLKSLLAENSLSDIVDYVTGGLESLFDVVGSVVGDGLIGNTVEIVNDITNIAMSKFPFSIITGITLIAGMLATEPETPYFSFDFKIEEWNLDFGTFEMDFSQFNHIAKLSRAFLFIEFTIGLIHLTFKVVNFIRGEEQESGD